MCCDFESKSNLFDQKLFAQADDLHGNMSDYKEEIQER